MMTVFSFAMLVNKETLFVDDKHASYFSLQDDNQYISIFYLWTGPAKGEGEFGARATWEPNNNIIKLQRDPLQMNKHPYYTRKLTLR